jgi:hypothetical protein
LGPGIPLHGAAREVWEGAGMGEDIMGQDRIGRDRIGQDRMGQGPLEGVSHGEGRDEVCGVVCGVSCVMCGAWCAVCGTGRGGGRKGTRARGAAERRDGERGPCNPRKGTANATFMNRR